MTASLSSKHTYLILNGSIIFFIILMMIAAKFGVFNVQCIYAENGESCTTCGVTRSFEAFLNLDFHSAKLSDIATKLFLFFSIQIMLRTYLSVRLFQNLSATTLKYKDIVISGVLFIWSFFDLILELYSNFLENNLNP